MKGSDVVAVVFCLKLYPFNPPRSVLAWNLYSSLK